MAYRTTFLDPDNRAKEPKTAHYCIRCLRDLKPGSAYRVIHVVNGGASVLHPAEEATYVPDAGEMGWFSIGMNCARIVGLDFTHDPNGDA